MLNQDLPERSQSSIGFPQAKDWVYSVANKLEEQHGLRRARKSSQRTEMQEVTITFPFEMHIHLNCSHIITESVNGALRFGSN